MEKNITEFFFQFYYFNVEVFVGRLYGENFQIYFTYEISLQIFV